MYASKSACLILPAGPDPDTKVKSSSASLALLLTAGLAKILAFGFAFVETNREGRDY